MIALSSSLKLSKLSTSRCLWGRRLFADISSTTKLKHIGMFRFKQDCTEAEMKDIHQGLLDLPTRIPQIREHELGQDLLLESGQTHPAGPNRQVSWTVTFDDVDGYQEYNTSPVHLKFLDSLKPVLEPGSRAAIQYVVQSDRTGSKSN